MQSEHNQFHMNSIKSYLSNLKNKEIKAALVYFLNDSCEMPRGPLDLIGFQKFFVCPIFLNGTV